MLIEIAQGINLINQTKDIAICKTNSLQEIFFNNYRKKLYGDIISDNLRK